jgi:hypothetical protein
MKDTASQNKKQQPMKLAHWVRFPTTPAQETVARLLFQNDLQLLSQRGKK